MLDDQGGFPALVQTLMETRGTVEPILYDHDTQQWESFMNKTGRAQLVRHYKSASNFANFGLDILNGNERQTYITRDMLTVEERYERKHFYCSVTCPCLT